MKLTFLWHDLHSFAHSREGAIAVIFALLLGALGGMMALAMDLGKAWNLETELQHAADACALAGATQLDGTDGARVRAIKTCSDAVANLVQNEQTFASDGLGADVTFDTLTDVDGGSGKTLNSDIKFYKSLPISAAVEATSDVDARFIEANVAPRQVDFAFAALVGAVTSANPRARAVAGFESFYCDSPPMMMCNPDEDPSGDAGAPFDFYSSCPNYGDGTSCAGRGITMKARAGAPEPGDFGYLALQVYDAETGTVDTVSGANELKDALASVEYGAVCTGNQVTTEPGNMASLDQFINQRFDLYPDLASATNANRQPAPNVGRGLVKKASFDAATGKCKYSPQTPSDPGDWAKPKDAAGDPEWYRGPGMHAMVDDDSNGVPDVSPYDASMGKVTPSIRAMAYPKDACNYTISNTNQAVFESEYAEPLKAGVGGCLFKAPPSDPTPEGEQIGTAQWDIQTYLDVYHPGFTEADFVTPCATDPDDPMCADKPNSLDPPIGRDGRISRWELYNWEKKSEAGTYPNMAFEEEPICYRGGQSFPTDYTLPEAPAGANTPDRRIIVMAVVNCAAMGGGRRTVPRTSPDGNVAVFLTEPMGYTLPDTLYGELIDPRGLGIGDVDVTPDLVQERILLIE